jgi:hypothetical protein
VAQARGALDRPCPLRPGRRPRQQLLRLAGAGAYPQLTQCFLGRADTTAVCEALCGSIPIITAAIGRTSYLDAAKGTVAGTPDSRRSSLALAPLLSHDHGKAPASRHVVRKPDPLQQGPAGG